jgi:hypothetical protein
MSWNGFGEKLCVRELEARIVENVVKLLEGE